MTRHEFLKATILAPIAAALAPVLGWMKPKSKITENLQREAAREVHKMLVTRIEGSDSWAVGGQQPDGTFTDSHLVLSPNNAYLDQVRQRWQAEPVK